MMIQKNIGDGPRSEFVQICRIGFIMLASHFGRRVFECLVIHEYSMPKMIVSRFLITVLQNWIILGIMVCYGLFHPSYVPPEWDEKICKGLIIGYYFTEVMNFICHMILRFTRSYRSQSHAIPYVHFISIFRELDLS